MRIDKLHHLQLCLTISIYLHRHGGNGNITVIDEVLRGNVLVLDQTSDGRAMCHEMPQSLIAASYRTNVIWVARVSSILTLDANTA